jgi:Hsp20/alpha crystallin family
VAKIPSREPISVSFSDGRPKPNLVLVDLPGVKTEDVAIELDDQVLTISGSRAPVEAGEAVRTERPSWSSVRRLTLPKGVDWPRPFPVTIGAWTPRGSTAGCGRCGW